VAIFSGVEVSAPRPRVRELGIPIGRFPPGPHNLLTDVGDVRVGHATLHRPDPIDRAVRTGVTVILPHGGDLYREKVRAAVHTINGYGKPFGFEQVRELGTLESPLALTNTFNVGLVADALVALLCEADPGLGVASGRGSLNVVVGETNDGWLNHLPSRAVRVEHVRAALEAARDAGPHGPLEMGSVGAGAGTICFGWKGGIGSASRVVPAARGCLLGCLVQSNFGRGEGLVVDRVPIGRYITPPRSSGDDGPGSIVIVLATDAPVSERQLHRIAVRAAVGLVRTGSAIGAQSGDFVIAFSTAGPELSPLVDEERELPALLEAAAEVVEESVLDSLCCATASRGRAGHVAAALPSQEVAGLVRRIQAAGGP
jgi:D-aminopeptidase